MDLVSGERPEKNETHAQGNGKKKSSSHHGGYRTLAVMAAASFVAMYVLMYMMVDTFANALPNLNQFFMAGMMTAPMVLIELVLMGAMYPDKMKNAVIMIASALIGMACIAGIRSQAGIGDREFLRSMIPHHAAALLMCKKAPLEDPEIKELCRGIVSSQQREIDWMRAKLDRP